MALSSGPMITRPISSSSTDATDNLGPLWWTQVCLTQQVCVDPIPLVTSRFLPDSEGAASLVVAG